MTTTVSLSFANLNAGATDASIYIGPPSATNSRFTEVVGVKLSPTTGSFPTQPLILQASQVPSFLQALAAGNVFVTVSSYFSGPVPNYEIVGQFH